ncbi:thioredoxin-like domain-containing protein [Larkinella sp. VNQ87]|uniref:thioredoxin-like domain-containing protein n=1 Tax=Larkinella sp. VNQ87 TaxID=3400921 RepID=UPI003BFF2ECF
MKSLRTYALLAWVTLHSLLACREDKPIQISGRLENMPDGEMIFYTRDRKTGHIVPMDSCPFVKGRFTQLLSAKKYPESIRVFMKHREVKTGTLRVFSFRTNLKYRGSSLSLDHFMLEDGIQINGKVSEDTFLGFRANKSFKLVSIDRSIIPGLQTQVAYNDTVGFGNLTSIARIKQLVAQHPYSYYYLYELERRVGDFSNAGFRTVFASFDQDVQQSETGQQLLDYVNRRDEKRLTFATTLPDSQGQAQVVLDKTAPYNLVVLWASWCGPCRQEIPELKQLYARFGHTRPGPTKRLHLVSVSVDENREAWLKAVQQEQMPWKQLLLAGENKVFARELFQFNGSIPTMLLVDQHGKTVRKWVGNDGTAFIAVTDLINETL